MGISQAAGEPRQTLFSCGVDPVDDVGFVALKASPVEGDRFGDLRFERIANDLSKTYAYPRDGEAGDFLFSHSDGDDGYLVSVRWSDAGLDRVLYSLYVRPDPAIENDIGGGIAGLATSKEGILIERVECAERPEMFITYLRLSTRCDVQAFDGDGCGEDPHARAGRLSRERLGLVP